MISEEWPFIRASESFYNPEATHNEISIAGGKDILVLYGCLSEAGLNSARLNSFHKKIYNAKSFVHFKDIPSTTAASKYHSFRACLLIQHLLGSNQQFPCRWGWEDHKEKNSSYIIADLHPAPENILRVMMKCGCICRCNSMRCTCRKNGIECSPACLNCRGIYFENYKKPAG